MAIAKHSNQIGDLREPGSNIDLTQTLQSGLVMFTCLSFTWTPETTRSHVAWLCVMVPLKRPKHAERPGSGHFRVMTRTKPWTSWALKGRVFRRWLLFI